VTGHIGPVLVTGEITLHRELDRETLDFFTITTMAQDGGGRTTFTSVYVTVTDINDNAPEFKAVGKHCLVVTRLCRLSSLGL